jgi:branched-subunit amino acid aminotransferase/4-amino-4-deoxychorismate lyase
VSGLFLIEIDGRDAGAEQAWTLAFSYGHFTAMQVRGGKTRGIALHLDRLEAANRELFGASLERERVLELVRHALGEVANASVRVYCFEAGAEPAIVVTVKDPGEVTTPQRLLPVSYQRPDAHLKHFATGQAYYSRLARGKGFDDALLTGPDGAISEAGTANIGFLDADGVVWPDAPHLRGITMQLLERVLPERGIPSRRAPISLRDMPSFDGAFCTSARGVAEVSAIDDVEFGTPTALMQAVIDAYAAVPLDSL